MTRSANDFTLDDFGALSRPCGRCRDSGFGLEVKPGGQR
jgi:hypothetical protein